MATLDLNKDKPKLKPLTTKIDKEESKESLNEQISEIKGITNFICYINNCVSVSKMFHWKTDSFAVHKAMQEYFEEAPDIIDSIAEQSMGKEGVKLQGFTDYKLSEYENYTPLKYFEEALEYVEEYRYKIIEKECTAIHNKIDELISLIQNTIYRLKFLK